MITSSRRGFIAGLGAVLISAPAIVRAGSLMPVKVIEPAELEITGYPILGDPVVMIFRPWSEKWTEQWLEVAMLVLPRQNYGQITAIMK